MRVRDRLAAVQKASVDSADLGEVLEFIASGPRVMNLRFVRGAAGSELS